MKGSKFPWRPRDIFKLRNLWGTKKGGWEFRVETAEEKNPRKVEGEKKCAEHRFARQKRVRRHAVFFHADFWDTNWVVFHFGRGRLLWLGSWELWERKKEEGKEGKNELMQAGLDGLGILFSTYTPVDNYRLPTNLRLSFSLILKWKLSLNEATLIDLMTLRLGIKHRKPKTVALFKQRFITWA